MWRVLLILLLKLVFIGGEIFGCANPEEKESCYWREEAQKQLEEKLNVCLNKGLAKNVIVFLADGMSVATVTAARIFLGQSEGNSGESSSLRFEEYPYVGLSKTYCVDKQVGDPACTSTAFLSGVKANYGTVGVTAEVPRGNCVLSQEPKNQVDTLLTWAQEAGKSTGIITGDRVTGPSPAGNYAHSADKAWENDSDMITECSASDQQYCKDIARQLVEDNPGKNIQVILGGGRYKLLPEGTVCEEGNGERQDGRNLVKEWLTHKRNIDCDAEYVTTRAELLAIDTERTDYLMGRLLAIDTERTDYLMGE
ncbi:hypothetical protein J6590_019511 [Homalodisca vitripennis]|nr:hypothetical protein J6590_019511 [Homalodisca vitripennis]